MIVFDKMEYVWNMLNVVVGFFLFGKCVFLAPRFWFSSIEC